MSSIKFNCPDCDKAYKVPEQYAGKKVKCKKCGSTMRVPGEKSGKSKTRSGSGEETPKSKRSKAASSKASKRSSTDESKPSKAKAAAARPATARIKRGKPKTGTQEIEVADITAELKRYERKREGDNDMARGTGRLVLFKGTKPKKSFRLSGDPVVVGRGEDADITLPMDSVSSEHIKMCSGSASSPPRT